MCIIRAMQGAERTLSFELTPDERGRLREFLSDSREAMWLKQFALTGVFGIVTMFGLGFLRGDSWRYSAIMVGIVFPGIGIYFTVMWRFGPLKRQLEEALIALEEKPLRCTVRIEEDQLQFKGGGRSSRSHPWLGISEWAADDSAVFIRSGMKSAMIPMRAFPSEEEYRRFVEFLEEHIDGEEPTAPWITR
jgi:hypothetical protein